jgi:hypothetical protein
VQRIGGDAMKLKVEMTLTAETAERFKETAKRLAGLGDDGLLAARVLFHIAESYERARDAKAAGTIPAESLNAENDK